MLRLKGNKPRIDLCGTPLMFILGDDRTLLICTDWLLSDMYDSIHLVAFAYISTEGF